MQVHMQARQMRLHLAADSHARRTGTELSLCISAATQRCGEGCGADHSLLKSLNS
jgi:hypothetical protein